MNEPYSQQHFRSILINLLTMFPSLHQIETIPLICFANQWTVFHIRGALANDGLSKYRQVCKIKSNLQTFGINLFFPVMLIILTH